MHGQMLILHLLIIPYSGLFSLGKYFCHFRHYLPVTKIDSESNVVFVVVGVALITVTKIILSCI